MVAPRSGEEEHGAAGLCEHSLKGQLSRVGERDSDVTSGSWASALARALDTSLHALSLHLRETALSGAFSWSGVLLLKTAQMLELDLTAVSSDDFFGEGALAACAAAFDGSPRTRGVS